MKTIISLRLCSHLFPRTSSAAGEINYDLMYYLKGAAAGGICCSITHGALTPVDVVKVCTVFAL